MTERITISSGAKWEKKVGYSRACRIGNLIEVSGTVALEDGELVGANDVYAQAEKCIEIIKSALVQAGASLDHVIRTRIYVTDITTWEEIGKAHGKYFKNIQPATSMVEVSKLISPEFLVEIEATAVVQ